MTSNHPARDDGTKHTRSETIVFAIYDSTTYRTLVPIAEELKSDYFVQFLLLDGLLPRANSPSKEKEGGSLPRHGLNNTVDVMDYVKSDLITRLNAKERPRPIHQIILNRALEDNAPPQVLFDLDQFVDDTDPDLFVCGHDGTSFVKHIIKRLSKTTTSTVVIQHGMNRPLLEFPPSIRGVPNFLAPSINPRVKWFEFLKRRFGYRYGAFPFCNPYTDEVYTIGDFFTERITRLRSDYPCSGGSSVQTVGSPEYNPDCSEPFDSAVDSIVFLSQWQYEGGQWNDDQQQWVVNKLAEISEKNGFETAVRPHPKESENKIEQFFSRFKVSTDRSLEEDVAEHDMALTVDSTAILEGVLQGKVCGVLQPPWNHNKFPPFTHRHILQLDNDSSSLWEDTHVEDLSEGSQRDYLQRYCYVPNNDPEHMSNTPRELIATKLRELL